MESENKMGGVTSTPERVSESQEQFEQLEYAVMANNDLINKLAARLKPVINESRGHLGGNVPEKAADALSPFAERVRHIRTKVDNNNQAIAALIERVEV